MAKYLGIEENPEKGTIIIHIEDKEGVRFETMSPDVLRHYLGQELSEEDRRRFILDSFQYLSDEAVYECLQLLKTKGFKIPGDNDAPSE